MRIWRRAAALLLALCMTVLLAACGEDPNDEKKLSVVMTGAVHTMDPAQVSTAAERTVVQHVFENLMRLNADGTVSHALARSYTQETALDGSVTYTFQLRTDAKWSDGTAVTARDFVYAWRRLVDPETASPNADALSMVAGYERAVLGDTEALQVTAPDDHRLQVVLSGSCPYFIGSVCTATVTMPVQEKAVTAHSNWSSSSLWFVGNGPYERTGDWGDTARLTLHTRAAYYDVKRLGPDRIDLLLKAREEADASAGKVDIVIGAGGEDAALGGDPTVGILLVNQMATSMGHPELRRALSLVIDRETAAQTVGQDCRAAEGLVPYGIRTGEGEEFRTANGALIDNDPASYNERCQGAQALLRQAGYTNSTTLSALDTVTLLYGKSMEQVARQLQESWASKLGVRVQLESVESYELTARLASGEFVLALMELTGHYNDASAYLDPWRSSDMRNYGMQYLKAYDILMRIAANSSSLDARDAYLKDAERLLVENSNIIPLYSRVQPYVIRDEVRGAVSDGMGAWYFGGVNRVS